MEWTQQAESSAWLMVVLKWKIDWQADDIIAFVLVSVANLVV